MEEMPRYVIVIVAAAVILALFLNTQRRGRATPHCPNCESRKVAETSRDTVGTRTVEPTGGGTPGGGSVRLQLDIEATYHCQDLPPQLQTAFHRNPLDLAFFMTVTTLITLAILLLLVGAGYSHFSAGSQRKKLQCEQCGEHAVVESSREAGQTRTVAPTGGFTRSGSNLRLQTEMEVTFYCQNCDRTFKRRFTQTH